MRLQDLVVPALHDTTTEAGFKGYFDYLHRTHGKLETVLFLLFHNVKSGWHAELRQTIGKLEGQLDQEINRRVKAEAPPPKGFSGYDNRLEDEKRKRAGAEKDLAALRTRLQKANEEHRSQCAFLRDRLNERGRIIDEQRATIGALEEKLARKKKQVKKLRKKLGL